MTRVLRAWDAPSARVQGVVDSNRVINGWLRQYGQERLNKRLKQAVRQTAFQVRMWEGRATARASSYEGYGESLQRVGSGLQGQAAQVQALQAELEQYNQQWKQRMAKARTPEEAMALRKEYMEGFRQRRTNVRNAAQDYEGDVAAFERARSRLDSYESRYEQGTKRYERAVKQHEAAVKRYNAKYYPVQGGMQW